MSYGIFNCEYEHLVGISFLERKSLNEKIELAKNGVTFNELEKLLGPKACKLWDAELEWADGDEDGLKRGHIFFGEDDYPAGLLEDNSSPFALEWKGVRPLGCKGDFRKAQSVTIVGTRQSSQEGRRAAYLLALEAVSNDIVVYSGYATGIDQASHKGACAASGKTIAVMPCGLANDYAFRNPELADEIYRAGGGFISQFCCLEDPVKWNFYARNRILAEITDATVVVQAPEGSGALITVRDALDLGRDVFVHNAGCGPEFFQAGTQGLVNDGAISINCYADLSKYTFGSFRSFKHAEEISYSEIEREVSVNPKHEPFFRFADTWYHIVTDEKNKGRV